MALEASWLHLVVILSQLLAIAAPALHLAWLLVMVAAPNTDRGIQISYTNLKSLPPCALRLLQKMCLAIAMLATAGGSRLHVVLAQDAANLLLQAVVQQVCLPQLWPSPIVPAPVAVKKAFVKSCVIVAG